MCGSQNIILQGRTVVLQDCIVRGDLAGVKIGRHCIIGERVVIRPPFKRFQTGLDLNLTNGFYYNFLFNFI